MVEEYISLIAQFGFPIAMCLWFMFKTDKVITTNTEAINRLSDMVEKLCSKRNI